MLSYAIVWKKKWTFDWVWDWRRNRLLSTLLANVKIIWTIVQNRRCPHYAIKMMMMWKFFKNRQFWTKKQKQTQLKIVWNAKRDNFYSVKNVFDHKMSQCGERWEKNANDWNESILIMRHQVVACSYLLQFSSNIVIKNQFLTEERISLCQNVAFYIGLQ